MSIDTNKDEGFNEFMHAMGFVFNDNSQVAPEKRMWIHKRFELTIHRNSTHEEIVQRYTRAVEQRTAKAHVAHTRGVLLDLMGLTVDDVKDRDGNMVVEDVVRVSPY